jgi:hypothetical protein
MVTDRGHEDAAVAVRELADGMREGVQALQDPAADLNREQVADRVRALFLPDQDEAGAGSSDSAPGSEGQPHTGS